MTASAAFILLIFGLLGIYAEFVWPGRVIPGAAGCVLAVAAVYFLWRNSPTPMGVALLGIAAGLFVAEALWRLNFIAGVAAMTALAWGFCVLLPVPRRISPAVAIPGSTVFGALTMFLLWGAKRARQNKRADIDDK